MNYLDPRGDAAYAIWSERSVIADCLRDLGFKDLAATVHLPETTQELINKFLNIIERVANSKKDMDVLDRLYFAGLVYG